MSEPRVLVEVKEQVGQLTLSRPDAMNGYDPEMVAELAQELDAIEASEEVRALVLTGADPVFCGGADVKLIAEALGSDRLQERAVSLVTDLHAVLLKLHRLKVPTVCAVNGVCAGGAVGMALACDITWAADTASFTAAFGAIGLTPDTGTSYLLPRAVGERMARELLLTNRRVEAEEAFRLGIVSRVLPHDELLPAAMQLASKLAAGPTSTLVRTRELVDRSVRADLPAHLDRERDSVLRCVKSGDLAEGVTAFLERRQPRFG